MADMIEQLRKELPKVTATVVDLSDWDATRKTTESFGAINHVVNNAGIIIPQPFMEITKDAASLQFNVNTMACLNVVQIVAKGMIERGSGGSIVNIASLGIKGAAPLTGVYAASKIATEMLTKNMSVELGPHNIRANCVAPNVVNTPMVQVDDPMVQANLDRFLQGNIIKRAIEPNEVADLVMFLLSPLSAMITGETVVIDGGFMANFL
ncbi:L-xylulose reductase [Orchesella cincta]|uniref:L-xylulose reductase n=1 Tax=Orchesella cincta TaxID=48709 RepID=A0A1D2MBG9_ORCCI|nr:L-xylulose reductase [Orchesella cincta]